MILKIVFRIKVNYCKCKSLIKRRTYEKSIISEQLLKICKFDFIKHANFPFYPWLKTCMRLIASKNNLL